VDDIRKNGMIGLIEYNTISSDKQLHVHFSEWWNGEGLDFTLETGKTEDKISLHMDTMSSMVVAMIASGMIDVDHCKDKADKLLKLSEKRKRMMDKLSEKDNF
jgi:hypothetical protein